MNLTFPPHRTAAGPITSILFVGFISVATAQQDTTAAPPTQVPEVRFIAGMGRFDTGDTTRSPFHVNSTIWSAPKYLGDLLVRMPDVWLASLGEIGKPLHVGVSGLSRNAMSVFADGRPTNDPLTESVDLYDVPIEAVEDVEILRGSASLIMSGNPGMTLNLLTPQYNTVRPVTKIRYLQGPHEYSLLDGLYTQNVAQGTNLMLGFQRHVSDGQFANSRFDSWNVRGRVRYNLSNRWNFALSRSYNRAINGMNGGIDVRRSPSLFNQVTAIVRTTEARHRTSRNDLTLSAIGKLAADSASTTQMTAYFSELEHERHDSASVSRVYTSLLLGVRAQQAFTLRSFRLRLGGETEHLRMYGSPLFGLHPEHHSAFFAHGKLTPAHWMTISGGLRFDWREQGAMSSVGGSVSVRPAEVLTLSADAYLTSQAPPWYARFLRPDYIYSEQHEGFVVGGTLHLPPTFTFSVNAYSRSITNVLTVMHVGEQYPLVFDFTSVPIHDLRAQGFTAEATAAIWRLEVSANVMFTDIQHGSTSKTYLPRWTARGELAYRQHLGSVDGRIGLRAHVASRHRGMQYHRLLRVFYENTEEEIGQFTVVDVFGTFRIGDAFIVVGWENVFDVKYMTTRWYPMPDRRFMLGVNWVFVD